MDMGNWGYFINHYNTRGLISQEEWEMEKSVDDEVFKWFGDNYSLPFQLCALYVIIVFGGQYYMEKREKFDLRKPLLCWSGFLAIFSIIGSIRCLITFMTVYNTGGVRALICTNIFYDLPVGRFWGMVFCLSKLPELVDTLFIVFRKQKLIFLHWYHHITVLLFSWYCYEGQRSGGAIFMTMNFIVHALMYTYYAFRAARFRVPRFIALIVTSCQILQMIVGCLTFCIIYKWRNDGDCRETGKHILYGGLMYFSYLVLFCHFFYSSYIRPSTPLTASKGQKVEESKLKSTTPNIIKKSEIDVPNFTESMMGAPDTRNLRSRKSKAS